jgi:hypothetical protein
VSNNEDGFKIERSPDGASGWTQIDTVGANVMTYVNTGLACGTYYYRVRAYNAAGDSGYSNVVNAMTRDCATLAGNVTLQGRPAAPSPRWVTSLTVKLTAPGSGALRYTFSPTTDSSGYFTLTGIEPGTYDVWVKSSHTLQNKASLTLTTGNNSLALGTLREGDANDDNVISVLDFSVLASTFNRCQGSTGYDSRADFNQDGCATLLDFSRLAANYDQIGASQAQASITALSGKGPQLSIAPSTLTVVPGQVFSVTIQVQAGAQQVGGAQAQLTFDPALLRVRAITLGASLPITLKSTFDNQAGTVKVAAGTLAEAPSGTFALAQIEFEALAAQSGTVRLKFETGRPQASDLAFGGASVLGSTSDGEIIVGQGWRVYLPLIRRSP